MSTQKEVRDAAMLLYDELVVKKNTLEKDVEEIKEKMKQIEEIYDLLLYR